MALPYAIRQFGTLLVPQHRESGQEDNLGTGRALTSWQQLPNGTYFDNYSGVARRPQGIRPITKEGVLYAATALEIEDTIDDLRAYLGVRDELTVRYRSGQLRWQHAVLIDVNTPARSGRALSVPLQLTWETVAQHWYKLKQLPATWVVGDQSFQLGDGTTGLGQASQSAELTLPGATTVTLTHAGNIPATNLVITVTATHAALTGITIANAATGHSLAYAGTVALGDSLIIDCGAMNITNDGADAYTGLTPSNRAVWMRLAAESDNVFTITPTSASSGLVGSIGFAWYDHYA